MGVVTVSSSASRTPLGLSATFSSHRSPLRRTLVLAFKINKTKNTTLAAAHKPVPIPVDAPKEHQKRPRGARKSSKRVKAVPTDEALPSTLEVDYNEAAAKLENIYKLSPTTDPSDVECIDRPVRRGRRRRGKSVVEGDDVAENKIGNKVVRNSHKKLKRLSLDMRIALRKSEESKLVLKRKGTETEEDRINLLVREYSFSSRSGSDWKRMKILPVLLSSEHSWLFKLMQPMKALLEVKENLQHVLGQEPTHGDLAEATKRTVVQVRKDLLVGRAARNKLIKHNLRLVLFAFKKYFQEFANGPTFEDLCQAGVKGLITAIDRFEPKRRFRLSTYALFWIRHFIMRSMTLSSFIRVPFGFESVRMEIQRAKRELSFQLQRPPTEEEIIKKVGISPNRYHDVMRASRPVASLHTRHPVTQEELIDRIVDTDSVGSDKWGQPALVRLALDDVLDSLMPKESLVIRQRYGLDGRGNRSLGEIAGNLNLSREMVRKYEMKALMKLKHPARVDYLRRYFFLKHI